MARYEATGKRKSSIARVILMPGEGKVTVNNRAVDEYFTRPRHRTEVRMPLSTTGTDARFDVVANITGGGISGQAGALRHGIARALLIADDSLRKELKVGGFLTRDSRTVERKKAGLKSARKRPQFSKR
ncbi:MAG: 30S ribosomal protein S9 [Thermoleophilia bacterium]|nr:30S ribosomal protein S9 [Thermoleophilia bacterium]